MMITALVCVRTPAVDPLAEFCPDRALASHRFGFSEVLLADAPHLAP
jgi:hypothetical protein